MATWKWRRAELLLRRGGGRAASAVQSRSAYKRRGVNRSQLLSCAPPAAGAHRSGPDRHTARPCQRAAGLGSLCGEPWRRPSARFRAAHSELKQAAVLLRPPRADREQLRKQGPAASQSSSQEHRRGHLDEIPERAAAPLEVEQDSLSHAWPPGGAFFFLGAGGVILLLGGWWKGRAGPIVLDHNLGAAEPGTLNDHALTEDLRAD